MSVIEMRKLSQEFSTSPNMIQILERIEDLLTSIKQTEYLSYEWLTVQQVADQLQVSRDTVERLIASGKLKASEINASAMRGERYRYRIRHDWVDDFLLGNVRLMASPPKQPQHRFRNKLEVDFIM